MNRTTQLYPVRIFDAAGNLKEEIPQHQVEECFEKTYFNEQPEEEPVEFQELQRKRRNFSALIEFRSINAWLHDLEGSRA